MSTQLQKSKHILSSLKLRGKVSTLTGSRCKLDSKQSYFDYTDKIISMGYQRSREIKQTIRFPIHNRNLKDN